MDKKIISYDFHIHTTSVEDKYADIRMISINCTKVEGEIFLNMYKAS